MAQLVVRNLDESVKVALRERAKRRGHSMLAMNLPAASQLLTLPPVDPWK